MKSPIVYINKYNNRREDYSNILIQYVRWDFNGFNVPQPSEYQENMSLAPLSLKSFKDGGELYKYILSKYLFIPWSHDLSYSPLVQGVVKDKANVRIGAFNYDFSLYNEEIIDQTINMFIKKYKEYIFNQNHSFFCARIKFKRFRNILINLRGK